MKKGSVGAVTAVLAPSVPGTPTASAVTATAGSTTISSAGPGSGLGPIIPVASVSTSSMGGSSISGGSSSVGVSSISGTSSSSGPSAGTRVPNLHHPCFQCSSLNENTAKKLCRKQPHALMSHTETQLMRTYPAGIRIDSSNFNPVSFWAFGVQMVALNYQTEDAALHVNAAMFEQNGRCGYVRKPAVMCDRGHMMYRRFNPWDKEFDGLHSSHLILSVISGQYVYQTNLTASVLVEVEMIGIPADAAKHKTKVVQRNALNPIWNDTFFFQIMFRDLAFLRFSVLDASTSHLIAQRVVPLTRLRGGYRHIRLRSTQNQPLQLATLFIYSRVEEESLDYGTAGEDALTLGGGSDGSVPIATIKAHRGSRGGESGPDMSNKKDPYSGAPLKRRMFFLMVHGVVPDEPYTILKITQESTTQEVILQALQKASLGADKVHDYILVEEVARSWEKKDKDVLATQRVLDPQERPLQAQGKWSGEGRFILKRMGDDPSSRAWLSSIRSTSGREKTSTVALQEQEMGSWEEADTFLVCVYNVSPEIPYAILKVPLSSSAQDVLAQALVKARRMEDPARFVLVEELEWAGSSARHQRVLVDHENVYSTQAHWQTLGRFVLRERDQLTPPSSRRHWVPVNLRTATLERISKGLTKAGTGGKVPVQEALSDPTAGKTILGAAVAANSAIASRGSVGGSGSTSVGPPARAASTPGGAPGQRREVHSEGETLSDEDVRDLDFRTAVQRLKKVSLRKFRVWKS